MRRKVDCCLVCGNTEAVDAVDNFGNSYKGYACHRFRTLADLEKILADDAAERERRRLGAGSALHPVLREDWDELTASLPKTTLTPEERESVHRANTRAASGHEFRRTAADQFTSAAKEKP